MTHKPLENGQHIDRFKSAIPIIGGYCKATIIFIILIISLPVYIFRQIVILWAKYFRPDLGEILNAQSSLFANELFNTRPLRNNEIMCTIYRGKFTLEESRQLVMKNWILGRDKNSGKLQYPKLQQHPVRWLGFTFYKNAFETFKIENHVHFHPHLNGKDVVSEKLLISFTEKLLNAPFIPRASPWEFHIIPNYYNPELCPDPETTAIILKIHHSLADGFGIMGAVLEGIFEYPLSNLKIPVPKFPRRTFMGKLKGFLIAPFGMIKEASYLTSKIFQECPWKIPDTRKEWYQFCVKSDRIPIQKVIEIKNALGVSFSSVLIASISAGIHQHLDSRKNNSAGNDGMEGSNGKGGSMICCSVLPIPGHTMQLTNHATAAFFDIPTGKFSTPLERLNKCYENLEAKRTSVMPILIRMLTVMCGCNFYFVGPLLIKNRSVSTGLTNFPLPTRIEINGKEGLQVDVMVGGLEGDLGVAVAVLSYNTHIRVCVTCEKAVMSKKELECFANDICYEINLLHEIVGKEKKIK